MSCFGVVGKSVGGGTAGGALEGCIAGVITSTYSWVAVPMAAFAWIGAVGGICGGLAGSIVFVASRCLGVSESGAKLAGVIAGFGISVIVQGGIFVAAGMTASAAFTAAASTLILPAVLIACVMLVMIAVNCIALQAVLQDYSHCT